MHVIESTSLSPLSKYTAVQPICEAIYSNFDVIGFACNNVGFVPFLWTGIIFETSHFTIDRVTYTYKSTPPQPT